MLLRILQRLLLLLLGLLQRLMLLLRLQLRPELLMLMLRPELLLLLLAVVVLLLLLPLVVLLRRRIGRTRVSVVIALELVAVVGLPASPRPRLVVVATSHVSFQ